MKRKADDPILLRDEKTSKNRPQESESEDDPPYLWIANSTLDCADAGCIPCIYKIVPSNGIFGQQSVLPPNKRPETCPRHRQRVLSAPFEDHSRVLTIGDGDFSFSYGLVKSQKFKKVVATSYENRETLVRTYPLIEEFMSYLENNKTSKALYEVDATALENTLPIKYKGYFDVIIWNFPCLRNEVGADAQVDQLNNNKNLVLQFLHSVKPYLRQSTSRVYITHKTIEPFCWWDVPSLAMQADYILIASVVFDICCYPSYVNRKALDKKSFPSFDAQMFIFQRNTSENNERDYLGVSSSLQTLGFTATNKELLAEKLKAYTKFK